MKHGMNSFPKFIIRRPVLLPQSRLYCIKPIGIGTPWVESLTGYISRVAEAHQLSVSLLFGHEFVPHANKEYLHRAALRLKYPCRIFASAFRPLARAMNGLGDGALEWIRVLQRLTLRNDLKYLTMLPFKSILPQAQLLRTVRAWCSACYSDWKVEGKTIYEPLLWALRAATICPIHHQPLSTACHHCHEQLYPLASRSKPGYCSNCERWLGNHAGLVSGKQQSPETDKTTPQFWESQSISDLLAAVPALMSLPPQGGIIKSLHTLILGWEGGLPALARVLQIDKTTIWQWETGKNLPRLDFLLKLCHRLDLSLLNFIRGEITARCFKREGKDYPITDKENYYVKRKRRPLDTAKARQVLRAALTEVPPPSLEVVAQRLGRDSNTLRYQLPDLCRAIVGRYKRQKKLLPGNKRKRITQALREILNKDSEPSSLADVARQLGYVAATLKKYAAKLCRAVTARYIEFRSWRWNKIQESMINALSEYPPPSILKLAERVGCSKTSLYSRFSSICHALAERRAYYRCQKIVMSE